VRKGYRYFVQSPTLLLIIFSCLSILFIAVTAIAIIKKLAPHCASQITFSHALMASIQVIFHTSLGRVKKFSPLGRAK
jgi:hypothetical protein